MVTVADLEIDRGLHTLPRGHQTFQRSGLLKAIINDQTPLRQVLHVIPQVDPLQPVDATLLAVMNFVEMQVGFRAIAPIWGAGCRVGEGIPLAASIRFPAGGSTILRQGSLNGSQGRPAIGCGQSEAQVGTGLQSDRLKLEHRLPFGWNHQTLLDQVFVKLS